MLFCICYVSLDGRKLVSNKLVCLSQLEFRTCQLFMKHFNDCYGSPFYATHHIADGLTVLLCLHTIIRAAHRNPVSTFYYMMGTISGVLIELGDALVADFLVYGSRRRLQHYKFKYGGHFVNRRVTMSMPILRYQSGWICFKYGHATFLKFLATCIDYLIFLLI